MDANTLLIKINSKYSIKTYENTQTQYNTNTKIYKMTYGKKEFNNREH